MKKAFAFLVAALLGVLLVAWWALRYAVFGVLLFLQPLVGKVLGGIATLCLIGLVLGLIIASDKHTMLLAFFGTGVASTVLWFGYDALLLTVAPSRFPLFLGR